MVTKITDIPGVKVPAPNERVLKVLACPELGRAGDFTILISIISPGYTTGLHAHAVDEYMYVVTGQGKSICRDEASEVGPDFFIFAPRNIEHEIKNTGEETLKLFCVFAPALKPAGYFQEAIAAAQKYFKKG